MNSGADAVKTEYRRDLNHNFIILSGGAEFDRNSYKVHMIEENHIPGFLRCHVEMLNDSPMFCYEITSRQSVSTLLEIREIGRPLLEVILRSLRNTFCAMEDYLLPGNGLLLAPEYIYVDADLSTAGFCYYPGSDEDLILQGQRLGEQFLPRLCHGDRQAVIMGYAFYQNCVEGRLSADILDEILGNVSGKPETEYHDPISGEKEFSENGIIPCETKEAKKTETDLERISGEFFDTEKKEEKKKGWFTGLCFGKRKKVRQKTGDSFGIAESTVSESYAGKAFLKEKSKKDTPYTIAHTIEDVVRDDGATVLLGGDQDKGTSRNHRAWLTGEAIAKGENYSESEENCGTGHQIFLDRDKYVIGKKSGSADIILNSPAVSRVHAVLSYDTDSYYLKDLNSKNGTKINNEWVRGNMPVKLKNGDRILFADVLVQYIMV